MIDHFITILHDLRKDSNQYLFLLECFKEQINHFYPNSTIHILTNLYLEDYENVVHHTVPDMPKGFINKLLLYGLIDVPAMYMDCDIIILKKFEQEHLPVENPFNLYNIAFMTDFCKLSSLPLDESYRNSCHYNTGIAWIPKPDKQIVKDLFNIRNLYFSDPATFVGKNILNDEHAVSFFVKYNGLEMKLNDDVNRFRQEIELGDIQNNQSVHYLGHAKENLFLEEYPMFKKYIKAKEIKMI